MVTAPYHIQLTPTASKKILALPPKEQKFVIQFAEALAINPRPPGARKIEGMTGLYCHAVHKHRLLYKIEEQAVLILTVK